MLAKSLWASHIFCAVTLLCIKAGCKRLYVKCFVRCTSAMVRILNTTSSISTDADNAVGGLYAYNLQLPQLSHQYMVKHVLTGQRDQFSIQPGAVQLALQSARNQRSQTGM